MTDDRELEAAARGFLSGFEGSLQLGILNVQKNHLNILFAMSPRMMLADSAILEDMCEFTYGVAVKAYDAAKNALKCYGKAELLEKSFSDFAKAHEQLCYHVAYDSVENRGEVRRCVLIL